MHAFGFSHRRALRLLSWGSVCRVSLRTCCWILLNQGWGVHQWPAGHEGLLSATYQPRVVLCRPTMEGCRPSMWHCRPLVCCDTKLQQSTKQRKLRVSQGYVCTMSLHITSKHQWRGIIGSKIINQVSQCMMAKDPTCTNSMNAQQTRH